jgi:hypothetical protein
VSEKTPPREGLCVYCGTARAVTKAICPECGRTWIDTNVGEDLPPLTPLVPEAPAEDRDRSTAAAVDLAAAAARAGGIDGDDEALESDTSSQDDGEQPEEHPEPAAIGAGDNGDETRQRPWGLLIGALIGIAAVALI